MSLTSPTSGLLTFELNEKMEIIEILCWGEIQILFGSWPNLTWHVCGGTTQPGLPGAVFGRVDDHDRGDKTRTSIEGRPGQ